MQTQLGISADITNLAAAIGVLEPRLDIEGRAFLQLLRNQLSATAEQVYHLEKYLPVTSGSSTYRIIPFPSPYTKPSNPKD